MSTDSGPSEILGKKVFFLYPSVVIQNQIITELAQQEYEVYSVKDHAKLTIVLGKYPDSIVFISIHDRLPEPDCEAWIRAIKTSPKTSKTNIGVISTAFDEKLERKYRAFNLECGYIFMKNSIINQAIKEIVEGLKKVDAKGRRKYIRAASDTDPIATLNIPKDGRFLQGQIKDISVVGLSCGFQDDPNLEKNSLFKDIQIKLETMILKAEGIIFGSHMDGANKVYVILFTQRIDPEMRTKIRKYIQQNLQNKMDKELG